MNIYRSYERVLKSHPFITQSLSAGALGGLGDALCQLVVEDKCHKGGYDWERTARFTGVISCVVAPVLFRWFKVLEKVKGKASFVPIKRMLIDQSVMAPCLTSTFITCVHALEGSTPQNAVRRTSKEIGPVLLTNYKVWPAIQVLNFYLVPLRYRIALVQFVGIFWNAYLSYMTQSDDSASKSAE